MLWKYATIYDKCIYKSKFFIVKISCDILYSLIFLCMHLMKSFDSLKCLIHFVKTKYLTGTSAQTFISNVSNTISHHFNLTTSEIASYKWIWGDCAKNKLCMFYDGIDFIFLHRINFPSMVGNEKLSKKLLSKFTSLSIESPMKIFIFIFYCCTLYGNHIQGSI